MLGELKRIGAFVFVSTAGIVGSAIRAYGQYDAAEDCYINGHIDICPTAEASQEFLDGVKMCIGAAGVIWALRETYIQLNKPSAISSKTDLSVKHESQLSRPVSPSLT